MLDRSHRLRRSADFTETVRRGRRAARGTLVVHYRDPGRPEVPARAGFVVSRALGGAVARNRVRRRLRHLVRAYLPAVPPGAVLVVRALPPAAVASTERLDADLGTALDRASSGRVIPARPRGRQP